MMNKNDESKVIHTSSLFNPRMNRITAKIMKMNKAISFRNSFEAPVEVISKLSIEYPLIELSWHKARY